MSNKSGSEQERRPALTDQGRLKGCVTVSRKFPVGRFGSFAVEFAQEFWLDESTLEEQAGELAWRLKQKTIDWGLVGDVPSLLHKEGRQP